MLNLSATLIAFLSFVAVVLFICVMAYRNADRLEGLSAQADDAEKEESMTAKQIEAETKSILDVGGDIAARRVRIQAEREKVVANQKRSSTLMSK